MNITPEMIETAARILAHREEYNENLWHKYAEVTEHMLRAAINGEDTYFRTIGR